MPKYKVKLSDGRTARITTDRVIESNEQMQQLISQQMGGGQTKASPDQFLSPMERLKGGFRSPEDLQQVREQQRAERGLASGTALEPTGFNLQNALDIPNDMLDIIGPAFPALGQLFGGLAGGLASTPTVAGIPVGVAAGGVAGAASAEAGRQLIGRALFGYDQGGLGKSAKRIALEGGLALGGELTAGLLGGAIRATKKGILKAAQKALQKKGVDGLVKTMGKIAPNVDPQKTQFALDALRAGDKRVLSAQFADEGYAIKFAEDLLFGGKQGNLSSNIAKLGRFSKTDEAVTALYKEFMGIPEEVTERVIRLGKRNMGIVDDVLSKEQYVNTLSRRVINKLTRAKDLEIERFGKELNKNMEKYGNKVIDMGEINSSFIRNLQKIGVIDEFGALNDDFANTKIKNMAKSLLDDFTDTGKIKNLSGNELKDALVKRGFSEKEALDMVIKGRGGVNVVTGKGSMKLSDAYKKWQDFKRTLPSNFFKTTEAKLSFPFASYFDDVAQKLGTNANMSTLNQRYGAFMSKYRQLENVFSDKSVFNKYIRQLDDIGVANSDLRGFEKMMPDSLKFVDDILDYNAVQGLSRYNKDVARKAAVKKLETYMGSAFNDSQRATSNLLQNVIDKGLPVAKRIETKARIHTTAKALNESAISLLRARFLAGGLGVTAAISGAGLLGSIGAVGAGLVLQDPKLFKVLLRMATTKTKLPERIVAQHLKQVLQQSSQGVSKQVVPSNILSNLLRMGVNQGGM